MSNKRIEIFTRDGKVVIDVEGQNDYMALDSSLAVHIGRAMIDAAVSLGAQVEVVVPPITITDVLRARMIVRIDHVIRSHEGKARKYVASSIVDTLLGMLP